MDVQPGSSRSSYIELLGSSSDDDGDAPLQLHPDLQIGLTAQELSASLSSKGITRTACFFDEDDESRPLHCGVARSTLDENQRVCM
jgi:hypothetical protein